MRKFSYNEEGVDSKVIPHTYTIYLEKDGFMTHGYISMIAKKNKFNDDAIRLIVYLLNQIK